jgi:DUF971 family protein
MDDPATPRSISAERGLKLMKVAWSDGTHCEYPFSLLRDACPCATCRNAEPVPEMDDLLSLPMVDPRATMIKKIELVGNYALTIEWEDGHHYGIYNWDYLRSLC